ncbi:aldolase [Polychaeton citri CBS 116435]|uniref:Aldolase n=1 Tax=Polychaeton citri CBS 116435 TaxID=1314669 RepID=A0A9P4UM48_9PEZI|nr:aldolase [Polychaeton citri CBS 116435]
MSPQVPPAGVWAPAITFFNRKDDTLDLAAQAKYFTYLSKHLSGLLVLGTNAETFHLTREERASIIETARSAVGPSYPLMAGCSGHSTKQVLEFISDAKKEGADYALVLPPAYFGGGMSTRKVVENFFLDIAERGELPIVVYNFPGVCSGVDIDSEMLETLAQKSKGKIVGVKLTCASVGKVTRLAGKLDPKDFAIFGGQSDFLLAGLSVGSAGCISAFGNIAPKAVSKVYELWKSGKTEEALKLQQVTARAESLCKKGIASTKYGVACSSAKRAGLEGDVEGMCLPRAPYEGPGEDVKKAVREYLEEVVKVEDSL